MIQQSDQKNNLLEFCLLRREHVPQVCELMWQTNASMSMCGVKLRKVNYTICQDVLVNNQLVMVVSLNDGNPIGYVLAIIDKASYVKKFPFFHPLVSMHILILKLIKRVMKKAVNKTCLPILSMGAISETPSGRIWKESSKQIAKIINIGVLEEYRRKGLGKELYKSLFTLLAKRGLKRIDANIAVDNMPSIRLHFSTGWRIEKTDIGLFATIDI